MTDLLAYLWINPEKFLPPLIMKKAFATTITHSEKGREKDALHKTKTIEKRTIGTHTLTNQDLHANIIKVMKAANHHGVNGKALYIRYLTY